MPKTLEELKEENRLAEEEEAKKQAEASKQKPEGDLEQEESHAGGEAALKPEGGSAEGEGEGSLDLEAGEEGEGSGSEIWMQVEGDEPSAEGDDKKFTDSDVASLRRKLKGKLQEEQDKASKLEEENAALRKLLEGGAHSGVQPRQQAQQQEQALRMPRMSDPDIQYDEDIYEERMSEWVQQKSAAATQQSSQVSQQEAQQREAQQQLEKSVDDHYQRAGELVKKSNIDPDVYKSADTTVRRAVAEALPAAKQNPKAGELIVDGIIARLGEGSEKVMFYLGRNPSKLEGFVNTLREDPTGIKGAMMLGEIKTQLTRSQNRGSNAPAPGADVTGDQASANTTAKLKREYEALTGNDTATIQKRFDIKRKAKAEGIDTKNW